MPRNEVPGFLVMSEDGDAAAGGWISETQGRLDGSGYFVRTPRAAAQELDHTLGFVRPANDENPLAEPPDHVFLPKVAVEKYPPGKQSNRNQAESDDGINA